MTPFMCSWCREHCPRGSHGTHILAHSGWYYQRNHDRTLCTCGRLPNVRFTHDYPYETLRSFAKEK